MKKLFENHNGVTLPEIMIATVVFSIAFIGLLTTYLRCAELNDQARNMSMATTAAKSRMEQIKNTAFNQIVANHHNNSWATTTPANGYGFSYVDDTVSDLLEIRVSICWQNKDGRIIGEDTNLNGVLNAGEDVNGNGMIDSSVQLVSYIFNE